MSFPTLACARVGRENSKRKTAETVTTRPRRPDCDVWTQLWIRTPFFFQTSSVPRNKSQALTCKHSLGQWHKQDVLLRQSSYIYAGQKRLVSFAAFAMCIESPGLIPGKRQSTPEPSYVNPGQQEHSLLGVQQTSNVSSAILQPGATCLMMLGAGTTVP
jgi:hypothetical protein